MTDFFIHIGYPKAASTSLQVYYFSRHPELFYLGPYNGGYSSSYYDARVKCAIEADLRVMKDFGYDEARVRGIFDGCREDFRRSGRKRLGFSFDGLSFTLHHDIDVTQKADRLRRLFGPDVKIIMVLRNQFDLLRSLYRTLIASGLSSTFQKYISDAFYNRARSVIYDLNYDKMFSLYADLFGEPNVLAVPMELLSTSGPEFLDRISGHLAVEPIIKEIGWENRSLDDAFYVAFRELNASHRYMMGAGLTEPSFQSRYAECYSEIDNIPPPSDAARETELAERLWVQARDLSRGRETKLDETIPRAVEEWLHSYYRLCNGRLESRTGLPLRRLGYP